MPTKLKRPPVALPLADNVSVCSPPLATSEAATSSAGVSKVPAPTLNLAPPAVIFTSLLMPSSSVLKDLTVDDKSRLSPEALAGIELAEFVIAWALVDLDVLAGFAPWAST